MSSFQGNTHFWKGSWKFGLEKERKKKENDRHSDGTGTFRSSISLTSKRMTITRRTRIISVSYLSLDARGHKQGNVVRPRQRVPHLPPPPDDKVHIKSQDERQGYQRAILLAVPAYELEYSAWLQWIFKPSSHQTFDMPTTRSTHVFVRRRRRGGTRSMQPVSVMYDEWLTTRSRMMTWSRLIPGFINVWTSQSEQHPATCKKILKYEGLNVEWNGTW